VSDHIQTSTDLSRETETPVPIGQEVAWISEQVWTP
jgi:hypothetical protein